MTTPAPQPKANDPWTVFFIEVRRIANELRAQRAAEANQQAVSELQSNQQPQTDTK